MSDCLDFYTGLGQGRCRLNPEGMFAGVGGLVYCVLDLLLIRLSLQVCIALAD